MYVCTGSGWAGLVVPRIHVTWEDPHPTAGVRWLWLEFTGLPANTDLSFRATFFRADGSLFAPNSKNVTTDAAGRVESFRWGFTECGGHVNVTVYTLGGNHGEALALRTSQTPTC